MSNFIINPLSKKELLKVLDNKAREIIKYFIIKSLFSQPESKIGQNSLPIQIPKEHIEQWFTQALDVKPVGAGSYPIDIYNERENWGADIKMLKMDVDESGNILDRDSGEASLGQKFSDGEINLDTLFASKDYEAIRNKWIDLYKTKYNALKNDYPLIKKVFYFFILRPGINSRGTNLYFAGAVLDLEKIDTATVNTERSTNNSVFLNNFVSDDYGNTKIYKAKKRLELRLRPKEWVKKNKVIKIITSFNPTNINLREEDSGKAENLIKKQIKEIQKIEIHFVSE